MELQLLFPLLAVLQQELLNGTDTTLTGNADILIPRDICPTLTYLCIGVTPGLDSSYSLPVDATLCNMCIDLTAHANCDG